MTAPVIDSVNLDTFSIDSQLDRGRLSVTMTGAGDSVAVSSLQTFLQSARREIPERHVRGVTFDVRKLYLLNSSCLKALLTFVFGLEDAGHPCGVRFVVDRKLGWQRRSLVALVRMAPHLVFLEDG